VILVLFVSIASADEIDDNSSVKQIPDANILFEESTAVNMTPNAALLTGKIWDCSSDINALTVRIALNSQDVYYTNGMFESKGNISVKVPSLYSQKMSFENPTIGVWSINGDEFSVSFKGIANGTQDTMTIVMLTEDTFITKGDNASLRECKTTPQDIAIKRAENRFSPEILTNGSWKCVVNEEVNGNGTYMMMESLNRYHTNGTSDISGVMKIKLDKELSEITYSVVYSEIWEFINGHFRTELRDVNITNPTNTVPIDDEVVLKEMVSLENIFKKGVIDEMEIVEFNENSFMLQDLSLIDDENKSRYICQRADLRE
jgi:hypothetical protein